MLFYELFIIYLELAYHFVIDCCYHTPQKMKTMTEMEMRACSWWYIRSHSLLNKISEDLVAPRVHSPHSPALPAVSIVFPLLPCLKLYLNTFRKTHVTILFPFNSIISLNTVEMYWNTVTVYFKHNYVLLRIYWQYVVSSKSVYI